MSGNLKYRILRMIAALETANSPIGCRVLAYHLQCEYWDARSVCQELVGDNLLWIDSGGYRVTTDGREIAATTKATPVDQHLFASWKQEALTGIDGKGKRSRIRGAALPTQARYAYWNPEDTIDLARRFQRLGITAEQIVEGRLTVCCKCKQYIVDECEECKKGADDEQTKDRRKG